jgi:hypothetical protein
MMGIRLLVQSLKHSLICGHLPCSIAMTPLEETVVLAAISNASMYGLGNNATILCVCVCVCVCVCHVRLSVVIKGLNITSS